MGRTINAGILYMLGMPYLLVGLLGYIWYKNRKKMEAVQEEQANLN
jgi:LPXTG-motif cell wall-anchored protein